MPLFGPPNIEKLKEKRDVKGLLRVVGDPKSNVGEGEKALLALGRLRATKALIDVLNHNQFSGVRACAARVLGESGILNAVEPLKAALWDEDVSDTALEALTALVPSAAPEYAAEPRIAVLTGRLQKGSKAHSDNEFLIQRAVEAARGLRDIGGPRASDALLALLTQMTGGQHVQNVENVFIACVRALGSLRESRAVEPLAALWGDTKFGHEALKALRMIDAARAEQLVREAEAEEQASWLTASGPFRADRDALRRHVAKRYSNWDDSPPSGHTIYIRHCRCGWESNWLPEKSRVDEEFKAHAAEMEALEATRGALIKGKVYPKPDAILKEFYRALDKVRETSLVVPARGHTAEGGHASPCPSCGAETPKARRCRHCNAELM